MGNTISVMLFFPSQKFIPVERFVFEIGSPEELSGTGRLEIAYQIVV